MKYTDIEEFINVSFDSVHDEQSTISKTRYLWVSDILIELQLLLERYVSFDHRFKWVSVSSVIHGPKSTDIIPHDANIKRFANEFVSVIRQFNGQPVDIDAGEYYKIKRINQKVVYKKVSWILGKYMIN
jgi:hypothetical protein